MEIIFSKPLANGEHPETLSFLLKDLKLLKRKFFILLKHSTTNETQQYSLRYFGRQEIPELVRLFNEQDFEGILKLKTAQPGKVGATLTSRYVLSGKMVCFQVAVSPPDDYANYKNVTPVTVYIDDDKKQFVRYAQLFDQNIS